MDKQASTPFRVYIKIFFLILIILAGVFILNAFTARQNYRKTYSQEITPNGVYSGKKLGKIFENEISANDTFKSASNELSKTTTQVLGEATKLKDDAIDQGKEIVTDYIYEHTVSDLIDSLINKLPEKQRAKYIQNLCK